MDDDFILDLAKIPPITIRKSEDFNVYLARIKCLTLELLLLE